MPDTALAIFAFVVVVYVTQSRRLGRIQMTAPIVFTALGTVYGLCTLSDQLAAEPVRDLAELTLALVLFHDAAQVQPRQLRTDAAFCLRLLGLALPLTVLIGFGVGRLLFPDDSVWLCLLLAAALAPTDAGLGAATVLNPVVPVRVRRILNVESGLNDGLVTPVVLFAVAAAGAEGYDGSLVGSVEELAVGLLVGVGLGAAAGRALSVAAWRGWVERGLLPVGTLAVPLVCYYGAVAAHGNGFVAAFVAGTACAAAVVRPMRASETGDGWPDNPLQLTQWGSEILGYAVWSLFGAVGVAHLGTMFTWQGAVFAVLSLTLLRMGPVALALLGSGLRRETSLFIGWFGPRGLASVVFALLAVDSLPPQPGVQPVIGAITTTVLLSVVLHGLTAGPWARRYGAWTAREGPAVESDSSVEPVSGRGQGPGGPLVGGRAPTG